MTQPRFLLDTNICIYIQKVRPEKVLRKFESLKPGEAALSVISFGELLYGAEKSTRRQEAQRILTELAKTLPVLPLPVDAAFTYGAIRADLEKRGLLIGNNDIWIAAHAKSANLILVSNNVKEFHRVKSLTVENWAGS